MTTDNELWQGRCAPGAKADAGKTRWDLVPVELLEALMNAEAFESHDTPIKIALLRYHQRYDETLEYVACVLAARMRSEDRDLKLVADVLTIGAVKYADWNWIHVPDAQARYVAAAIRHIHAVDVLGEELDPETGLPHVAHALCCVAFLLWFDRNRPADRWYLNAESEHSEFEDLLDHDSESYGMSLETLEGAPSAETLAEDDVQIYPPTEQAFVCDHDWQWRYAQKYRCSKCGKEKTEPVSVCAHSYIGKPPTSEPVSVCAHAAGGKDGTCMKCGAPC